MIDLAIVGGGISALTAAIYASRDGLAVQIFEKQSVGGAIIGSVLVENYPAFPDGISGLELTKKIRKQAEKFGAKIEYGEVKNIKNHADFVEFEVDGEKKTARMMLLAVGNSYKKIGFDREEEFLGRGIHFCATCDGAFYSGEDVIVVGGGNSALTEAIFLSRFSKVNLLVRSKIRAEKFLQEKLFEAEKSGKIKIFLETEIEEIITEQTERGEKITGVKVRSGENTFELKTSAIFEAVGLVPNTDFLQGSGVELNENGEIIVDLNFRTNLPRVFASGDVVAGAEKQLVIAAGSGAKAAIKISKILHDKIQ